MSGYKPNRGAKSYRVEQNSGKIYHIETKLMIKSGIK